MNGTGIGIDQQQKQGSAKRVSNGSLEADTAAARVVELQDALDKTTSELHSTRQRLNDMTSRYGD